MPDASTGRVGHVIMVGSSSEGSPRDARPRVHAQDELSRSPTATPPVTRLPQVLGEHPELTTGDPVVVALPRGGVPSRRRVARCIDAPLDVIIVRKLGAPGRPELAMGALGEGGTRVLEHDVLHAWHVSDEQLAAVEAREQAELARRAERLRAGRTRVSLQDRPVIVVDDGVATGSTARAAIARGAGRRCDLGGASRCRSRRRRPWRSSPRSRAQWCAWRCRRPSPPSGSGTRDFSPTTDDEVVRILDEFRRSSARAVRATISIPGPPPLGPSSSATALAAPASTLAVAPAEARNAARSYPPSRNTMVRPGAGAKLAAPAPRARRSPPRSTRGRPADRRGARRSRPRSGPTSARTLDGRARRRRRARRARRRRWRPAGSGKLIVRPRAWAPPVSSAAPGAGVRAGTGASTRTARRVVPEDVLGAVAVVHVPVDDQHPLAARRRARRRRRRRC